MKDLKYIERVLNSRPDIGSESDNGVTEANGIIGSDAAIWFLLGKGLHPQEVFEVLATWWNEGHSFARAHK